MAGQGWSGVLVCLQRVISKSVYTGKNTQSQVFKSSVVYFIICILIVLSCLISFWYVKNSEYTNKYIQRAGVDVRDKTEDIAPPLYEVAKKIWIPCLNLILVFVMTFLVFPNLTVNFTYHNNVPRDWAIIISLTVFNIADLIGRSLPSFFILFDVDNIIWPILARYILLPFYYLSYFLSYNGFFNNMGVVYTIGFLSGISNGYLASLVMMHTPTLVPQELKPKAGVVLSTSLNAGILLGSLLSFVFFKIVHHDPIP